MPDGRIIDPAIRCRWKPAFATYSPSAMSGPVRQAGRRRNQRGGPSWARNSIPRSQMALMYHHAPRSIERRKLGKRPRRRSVPARGQPSLQAVEIKIDDRRGEQGQKLAQCEAANHRIAEWLAKLRARAGPQHQRHAAEQGRQSSRSDESAAGRPRISRVRPTTLRARERSRNPPA
jgi:hypothetical protein